MELTLVIAHVRCIHDSICIDIRSVLYPDILKLLGIKDKGRRQQIFGPSCLNKWQVSDHTPSEDASFVLTTQALALCITIGISFVAFANHLPESQHRLTFWEAKSSLILTHTNYDIFCWFSMPHSWSPCCVEPNLPYPLFSGHKIIICSYIVCEHYIWSLSIFWCFIFQLLL